jgi:hypothetical protein
MKYFVPDIRIPEDLPEASALHDRFGGIPWGLPNELWPRCSDCGGTQSFLAQFQHHKSRLNLGGEGRVLYVFQCNRNPGMCATWEGGSGANACFVIAPDDQLQGFSAPPADQPPKEPELRVAGWLERNDGISSSFMSSFFSDNEYFALEESLIQSVPMSTKLGGPPCWIQSPSEAPSVSEGWRFIGQLDSTYSFLSPPSVQKPWLFPDTDGWEGRTHIGQGPNFGDGGIAYLFLRPEYALPEGWFFWQCG